MKFSNLNITLNSVEIFGIIFITVIILYVFYAVKKIIYKIDKQTRLLKLIAEKCDVENVDILLID